MKYKITRKIIECEIDVKLSYNELQILVNSIDQVNRYQRGINVETHELRDELYSAQKEIETGL